MNFTSLVITTHSDDPTNFFLEIKNQQHYVAIQRHLFSNGYHWMGSTGNQVRKSTLNPATHMIVNEEEKTIKRFLNCHNADVQIINAGIPIHKRMKSANYLKRLGLEEMLDELE